MTRARLFVLGMGLALLGGCGGNGNFDDLRAYMDEVRAKPKGSIEPLPSFLPYEAFTYSAASLRHPFQPPMKLDLAQRHKGSKDIKPDESRVKQFLEQFNIENFVMVGTLASGVENFALIRGGDGVHRVKVGDYLGRNHGRIVDISEAEVNVVEIVPDGDDGWLERPRSLTLKERS